MFLLAKREKWVKTSPEMDSSVGSLDLSAVSEVTEYNCEDCKYSTTYKSNYNKHRKTHQPNFVTSTPSKESTLHCDQCGRAYKSRLGLRLHILNIHEKNFKYKCRICGKGFNQTLTYRSHCGKHTGFGLAQCKLCKKSFTTSYSLKRHMGVCNKNPDSADQEQYHCDICDGIFARKSSLAYHMRGKHQPPRYLCHHCGCKYSWRSSLKAHIKFAH